MDSIKKVKYTIKEKFNRITEIVLKLPQPMILAVFCQFNMCFCDRDTHFVAIGISIAHVFRMNLYVAWMNARKSIQSKNDIFETPDAYLFVARSIHTQKKHVPYAQYIFINLSISHLL